MKRIVVFLLSFLLLVFISISVGGNTAFAHPEQGHNQAAVVNLICSLSTATPPTFDVIAFSSSANLPTTVTLTVGEECAQALADLSSAGLQLKDVQSIAPNVIYSLGGRN
jgi:hypothetical protein